MFTYTLKDKNRPVTKIAKLLKKIVDREWIEIVTEDEGRYECKKLTQHEIDTIFDCVNTSFHPINMAIWRTIRDHCSPGSTIQQIAILSCQRTLSDSWMWHWTEFYTEEVAHGRRIVNEILYDPIVEELKEEKRLAEEKESREKISREESRVRQSSQKKQENNSKIREDSSLSDNESNNNGIFLSHEIFLLMLFLLLILIWLAGLISSFFI